MRIPIQSLDRWTPDPKAPAKLESIRLIIESLLALKEQVHRPYLKKFLSNCIWKATEAEGGKYRIRYCSEAAVGVRKNLLHHEHVVSRKSLVEALLNGEPVESVLSRAVACIVTREEHERLPPGEGWERYRGIKVIDRATGEFLALETRRQ
jgi:hypothetical protein